VEIILASDIFFAVNADWRVGDFANVGINQEKEEKNLHESILLGLYCPSCFFAMERVFEKKSS
jgi:hypothetical protein